MPVTRSSSILSAQSSSQTRKRTPKPSSEVILLSDDDTLPKRRPSAPNLRRGRSKAQAKPAIVLSDVLEISSDEDNLPVSKRSPLKSPESSSHMVRNLRNQITALERMNAKLQQDYRSLKAKSQAASTALDDHISCDICALHLWSPYILPECGHTFCSSCLEEWFEKTLTQHLRNHPFDNVDANAIGPPPLPNQLAYADALLTRLYANTVGPRYHQQPQSRARYSCPSCRTEVRSRPAEEFTLKALVRTIAAEAGESSPKRAAGCASRETGHNSPWDKFFGKATRIPPIP